MKYIDPDGREDKYVTDYGKESSNPYVVTGKNIGGNEFYPNINIVLSISDDRNNNGAFKGTLTVYYSENVEKSGVVAVKVPIVHGNKNLSKMEPSIFHDVIQEKTSTSSNPVLSNNLHGGEDNIMIRLKGTDGVAIHQGNKKANQDYAYTEGCFSVTSLDKETSVEKNYKSFIKAINPLGFEGAKINVIIE